MLRIVKSLAFSYLDSLVIIVSERSRTVVCSIFLCFVTAVNLDTLLLRLGYLMGY